MPYLWQRASDYPSLQELLGDKLLATARWRRLQAGNSPSDSSDLDAAVLLERLAAEVPSYEGTHTHIDIGDAATVTQVEAFQDILSHLMKEVGFERHPSKLEDFLQKLFNDLTWAGRAGHYDFDAFDAFRALKAAPVLLVRSVVELQGGSDRGALIIAVTQPWFEIVRWLQADHSRAFQMEARQWEELIAGAYQRSGFDRVILTPRSGDYGRDIIAEKRGIGTVRVIDQVKAYARNHLVTADDVRALLGVLTADGASKGFLTTTSSFAPRLASDPLLAPFIPSRLELVDGKLLLERLQALVEV